MKHRFQYLDERGQQVKVKDLSALREHVHSGRVDNDTLLYDSLTDQWAPASAHSAYRLLDDPLARDTEADPTAGEEAEGDEHAPSDPNTELDFPDLDVTLAPDDVIESTDEVVEKLLRERERDRGGDRITSLGDPFGRGPVPEREPGSEPEPDDRPTAERRPPRGPRLPDADDEPIQPRRRPRRARSGSRVDGDSGTDRRAPKAPATSAGSWRRVEVPGPVVVLGVVLLVGAGIYGLARTMDPSGAAEASTGGPGSVAGTARAATNSAWAAAEGGAFRDMVEGVDSLRTEYAVQRIPSAWLAGPYLADADSFPQVREYWSDYLRFVEAVRSRDTALFRRSFVDRVEAQGVTGPIVSIRLARALETFRASQPARDTVYERMEDLASSALDLHELLVDRADDIVYDPVTEERASRQPILEAWSDDVYLRRSIWALLDRITANLALLEGEVGSGQSDLTERLFQELRTRSVGPEGNDEGG